MKYTIKQKIYKEEQKLKSKLYTLEVSLSRKQEKMLLKQQEKQIQDNQKIIDKIERERKRKIKSYQDKTNKAIKNLEREEKGEKKVVYKKKPKLWGKEFQKLLTLIQLKRRLECADEKGYCKCYTCDNIRHYKGMHGGHFISRANKNTARRDINIHSQCPNCNAFHYGRPIEYKEHFIKDYGLDEYKRLDKASKEPIDKKKYDLHRIQEEIKKNKIKIKQLKSKIQ